MPGDPDKMFIEDLECPPLSEGHILGVDDHGFDVARRLVHGGAQTLGIALGASSLALLLGLPLGALSGIRAGRLDSILMLASNTLLSFPALLLALCLVTLLAGQGGRGSSALLAAVALVEAPKLLRQARAAFRLESRKDYCLASLALGAPPWRLALRTLLPNALPPVVVAVTLGMGSAVLEVAGLSFLGLGLEPGSAEWGLMVAEAQAAMASVPWAAIAPGTCIFITVLGFNMMGDGLQDALQVRAIRS